MDNTDHVKQKTLSSILWKFMERMGLQGIQFIVQIFLARMLAPDDYGIIAIVLVFINFSNVFIQSGFSAALIQKKDTDDIDFSSVFFLSLIMSIILYLVIYFTAPSIANFYNQPMLVAILRVLSLSLIFGSYNAVQNSYISKNFMFKQQFYSSTIGMCVASLGSIILAYFNFGVWALVFYHLISQIMTTILLIFIVRWRIKFCLAFSRIKHLYSFGWKLLVASLLDTAHKNFVSLIVGRSYNSETLGFYNRGESFPNLITSSILGSIQSVLFPVLSFNQDDNIQIKKLVRRTIVISSYIVFPLMIGLATISEPLVRLLLTEKWLPAVPFMQILCFSYALWPIHTANLQAINALGRSDVFLKLEVIKKTVGIVIIIISIPLGIYAMAWGVFLSNVLSSFINAFPNSKLLNYNYFEQWRDIAPSLLISIIMGMVVFPISLLGVNSILTLLIQIITGVVVYIALSVMFRLESFNYLCLSLKEFYENIREK